MEIGTRMGEEYIYTAQFCFWLATVRPDTALNEGSTSCFAYIAVATNLVAFQEVLTVACSDRGLIWVCSTLCSLLSSTIYELAKLDSHQWHLTPEVGIMCYTYSVTQAMATVLALSLVLLSCLSLLRSLFRLIGRFLRKSNQKVKKTNLLKWKCDCFTLAQKQSNAIIPCFTIISKRIYQGLTVWTSGWVGASWNMGRAKSEQSKRGQGM